MGVSENRWRWVRPGGVADSAGGRGRVRAVRGFSLVDILVSLGVIAVLMAILLPSLSAAQEAARRIKCASNMRQVGMSTQMYAYDNRDRVPPSVFENSDAGKRAPEEMIFARVSSGQRTTMRAVGGAAWDGLGILAAKEYVTQPEIFYCPSHKGAHTWTRYAGAWKTPMDEAIASNFHYRIPGNTRQLSKMTPYTTLVADGMRTQDDYNHVVGNNMLKADMSVSWFSDSRRLIWSSLRGELIPGMSEDPVPGFDRLWDVLDSDGNDGLRAPGGGGGVNAGR
ncbi:MAG: type II secretion system protein [Phycisphaerales bacterium]|nr:type II secretion system protein [Phycisphaerales bacterium]